MPPLPTPFRAAVGLAAEAVEQVRNLPDKAIELPMLAVSTALQVSLRLQQRYALLAARGEDVLSHRQTTDEPPAWATFDEPVPLGDPAPLAELADDAHLALADDRLQPPPVVEPEAVPDLPRKRVRRPRNAPPSRFDAVGDE